MTDSISANLNTSVADGSGRFRIITEPALPAVCAVCRRSANGIVRFIDFNFDLDYYGAVVFCEDCFKEGSSLIDLVPREDLVIAQRLADTGIKALEVAQIELDKYKSALDSLSVIRPDLVPAVLANDVGAEDADEASGNGEQSDEGSEQDESDSNGSDSVGGLADVSIFKD